MESASILTAVIAVPFVGTWVFKKICNTETTYSPFAPCNANLIAYNANISMEEFMHIFNKQFGRNNIFNIQSECIYSDLILDSKPIDYIKSQSNQPLYQYVSKKNTYQINFYIYLNEKITESCYDFIKQLKKNDNYIFYNYKGKKSFIRIGLKSVDIV